jgi:Na+/proline symporter
MKPNIGNIDRILRVVVGLVLLSLVFVGPKTLWGLIGLVPLGTAAFRFCPAYWPFGLNTCGTRQD